MATKQTVEQERAQDAWGCALEGKRQLPDYDKYVNDAKGLPSLIMNSGLMQVMAFLHEKGNKLGENKPEKKRYDLLAQHLRNWLHKKYKTLPPDFACFMTALMQMEARPFQAVTTEAFAWLKWLRQIAPAVEKGN